MIIYSLEQVSFEDFTSHIYEKEENTLKLQTGKTIISCLILSCLSAQTPNQ